VAPLASAIPAIDRVEVDRQTVRAYSAHAGAAISPLIEAVASAGRSVRQISLAEPSLETLFISLTGRKFE
jgi:ABC-2 type transport system ATP-binding protein